MYSNVPTYPVTSTSPGSAGSVLSSFPPDAAHSVVTSIVKTVSSTLGLQIAPPPSLSSVSLNSASSSTTLSASIGSSAQTTSDQNGPPTSLQNDAQINWFMEVVCHGLSLPLTEHETIKDCVNIYCEWLSALFPKPKSCVPHPIVEEPNRYARKIVAHLYHLFVPRKGEATTFLYMDLAQETIHKQAVLCHRVLRRIQDVVQQSDKLERETWESFLAFLLAINDALLAPPAVKDDVGDQLCERVLGVLYEIWLLACVRCFPSPPLWKTFREMCMNWRHRTGLIDQWNKVNILLTARLLEFMYGAEFPRIKIPDEEASLIPLNMTNDCVAQTWFRLIHSLGNPVDLSRPSIVSQTQQFYQYAIVAENVIDPTHHPCLAALPAIFLKSMKGVSAMVDAFLGLYQEMDESDHASSPFIQTPQCTTTESTTAGTALSTTSITSAVGSASNDLSLPSSASIVPSGSPLTPTPPSQRRNLLLGGLHDVLHHPHLPHFRRTPPLDKTRAASIDVAHYAHDFLTGLPKASQLIGLTRSTSTSSSHQTSNAPTIGTSASSSSIVTHSVVGEKPILSPTRPKCNAILHMFGKWLFEASFIGTSCDPSPSNKNQTSLTRSDVSNTNGNERRPSSLYLEPNYNVSSSSKGGNRRTSTSSQQSTGPPSTDALDLPPALTPDRFESGRAEAIGALCRIFCSKKSGEEILPVYLGRFYLALQQGLIVQPDKVVSEVLAMILINCSDLLRLDLDGVHILLPSLIPALEVVLAERDLKMRPTNVHKSELRRAAINILISMLPLPSQFENLSIKTFNSSTQSEPVTFASLMPRIINLVVNALQVETEAVNTQMLLGGLMFLVQDKASFAFLDDGQHKDFKVSLAERPPQGHVGVNGSVEGPLDVSLSEGEDSAHAVFVRATYLVCHRLISSWKSDLNTSLAALELLGGLAKIKLPNQDPLECKRAVKWICDYIVAQCSRPPPAHSRDLHSSIVAAFRCLKIWILYHPYLLQDKECLATVMEVVEQGVSGTKSRNKASDEPIYKEEKVLSPSSRRVKDAAEAILTCILEQVDNFPSKVVGAESLSSLLDEAALLRYCNNLKNQVVPMTEAVQSFRYIVVDNSFIMAILEEPLGSDYSTPTVTVLLRTSSCRSAWTMELRQLPRHKSESHRTRIDPGRPLSLGETNHKPLPIPKFFPDSIDRIPLCKADKSIPAVESVAGDEKSIRELDKLSHLMDQQATLEEEIVSRTQEDNTYNTETECKPPEPCKDFQTARLILSHLGLLNVHSLRDSIESPIPKLVALDSNSIGFVNDLESLDRISPRTADTVHIFYCKTGQTSRESMLDNVNSAKNVHPYFIEFLSALGWPVNTWRHPGWTGHVSTSWRVQTEPMTPPDMPDHGGGAFNGDHYALYWADAISEIAFVVPTSKPKSIKKSSNESIDKEDSTNSPLLERRGIETIPSLTLSLGENQSGSNNTKSSVGNKQTSNAFGQQEVKIMVVWLERMEDQKNIPLPDLITDTSTGLEGSNGTVTSLNDLNVIYVQPLQSGLLRIKMQGQISKMSLGIPLVDGGVVSRHSLAPLVRQTSLNIASRRRLEVDSFHPPHVRRKLKIQEIVQKYRSHMTESEFFAHLFTSPPKL